MENSWPVRTRGSTAYLWDTVQYQIHGGDSFSGMARTENNEESDAIAEAMYYDIFLTDEDLPILFTPIDEVRFPITLPEDESMAWALAQLNEEDGTPKDVDIDALAQQIVEGVSFDDALAEIDDSMISMLYNIEGYTDAVLYKGSGATAEEVAIFQMGSSDDAKTALEQAQAHIQSQIDSYESYIPEEVSRLEDAVVRQDGSYVSVVVSADAAAAEKMLDEAF